RDRAAVLAERERCMCGPSVLCVPLLVRWARAVPAPRCPGAAGLTAPARVTGGHPPPLCGRRRHARSARMKGAERAARCQRFGPGRRAAADDAGVRPTASTAVRCG